MTWPICPDSFQKVRENRKINRGFKIYCLGLILKLNLDFRKWCSDDLAVLSVGLKAVISRRHLRDGWIQARIDSSEVWNAVWKEVHYWMTFFMLRYFIPSEGSLLDLLFKEAEVFEFLIGPEVLDHILRIVSSKRFLTCWEIVWLVWGVVT